MRREDIPGEQRQGGAEAPVCGQDAAEFAGIFVGARDRIDRPERGDGDFAGRHSRHQRHVDLPIEADRAQYRLHYLADARRKTVIDRRLGGVGCKRDRAQKPDHDHHRKDRRAGPLQENLAALHEAERYIPQYRPLVVG